MKVIGLDLRPHNDEVTACLPQAAWTLQVFATTFYAVFSVVVYVYLGNDVQSPALLSLSPVWSKITFAFGLVNFML